MGELEQLFSYVTHCINLIHIAINFHQDISYRYLVIHNLHKTASEVYQRDVTPKNK